MIIKVKTRYRMDSEPIKNDFESPDQEDNDPGYQDEGLQLLAHFITRAIIKRKRKVPELSPPRAGTPPEADE